MKNLLIQAALLALVLCSTSCRETNTQEIKRTRATAITFISPEGVKTELKLDDGDGRITSGFKGQNRHAEVRELALEETKNAYIIHTDGKLYYLPLDYALEVSIN